jgi:hypothetical protein
MTNPKPRLVSPGETPRSWYAMFQGGPMDGENHGIIDVDDPPGLLPWEGGRYRLLSKSKLDPALDLTGQNLLRGCQYAWEVTSRAETPPLPGGQPHP